jgi:hypothetical protein
VPRSALSFRCSCEHEGIVLDRIVIMQVDEARGVNALAVHVQVAEYASSEFKREVAWTKPEHHVHLAKACLLIALEEEAARELNKDSPSNE